MLNQVDRSPSSSLPAITILLVKSPSPCAMSFDISTRSFTGAVIDLLTRKPKMRLISSPIMVMIITTQMKVSVSPITLALIAFMSIVSTALMSSSILDKPRFNSVYLLSSNSLSLTSKPDFLTLSKVFPNCFSTFENASMLFFDSVSLTILAKSSRINLKSSNIQSRSDIFAEPTLSLFA